MTITTIASETYERSTDITDNTCPAAENCEETQSSSHFPKLFWAGIPIFCANLLVLGGIALSPELNVSVYGQGAGTNYGDKPSPFTEVVDTAKPPKVKLAEKVRPVIYQEVITADNYAAPASSQPTDLSLPRASQQQRATLTSWSSNDVTPRVRTEPAATTVRGNEVYRAVESYGDFRRVSAMNRDLVPPTPKRITN